MKHLDSKRIANEDSGTNGSRAAVKPSLSPKSVPRSSQTCT